MRKYRPKKAAVIVRTAGNGVSSEQIREDIKYLEKLMKDVRKKSERATPPTLIHEDVDITVFALRDLFTEKVDQIIIDDKDEHERLRSYLKSFAPQMASRVKLYKEKNPIFDYYEIESEIETLRQELQAAEEACRELDAQAVTCQVELDQNHAQIGVLEATEAAECPVCHEPLTPEHRAELLAEYRTRQAELEAALAEASSRQNEAEETRRQKREALDDLEKQLQKADRLGRPHPPQQQVLLPVQNHQHRHDRGGARSRLPQRGGSHRSVG